MTQFDLAPALPEERTTLANMFQLYVHDFSEQWAGREDGELGDDGLFEPYPYLDAYWSEPGRVPLILRADGRIAGFVLINDRSHSGLPVDRNVAEFFVVRKHRRDGAGTFAARAAFALYPGVWEAAVARTNLAALAFWRQAILGCPDVSEIEELNVVSSEWNGPILRFRKG